MGGFPNPPSGSGGGGGNPSGSAILTSSGQTWNVPAGVSIIRVRFRNAGAGGGGASGSPGGGGSAGCALDLMLPVIAGHTLTATIGAGGTGGASGVAGTNIGSNGVYGGIGALQDTTSGTYLIRFNNALQSAFGRGGAIATGASTQGGAYGAQVNALNNSVGGSWIGPPGSGGTALGAMYGMNPMVFVAGGIAGNATTGGYAQQQGDPYFYGFANNLSGNGGGSTLGINGMTATEPGCGGGGGGGQATAGLNGGTGGGGAPGSIEIYWGWG